MKKTPPRFTSRSSSNGARRALVGLAAATMALLAACADDSSSASPDDGLARTDDEAPRPDEGSAGSTGAPGDDDGEISTPPAFALASVVIDPEGARTTYVQGVASLDDGPFDNSAAIELPGNGVVLANDEYVFVGSPEEPIWTRYHASATGALVEEGRVSLGNFGASRIGFGNALVDEDTAVSVISDLAIAVVWNPSTMETVGEIDLGHLVEEGYQLENWTVVAHEGRAYVPGRWADWEGARILPKVSVTILDPDALSVVAVAEDERCASGGRIVFGEDGYGYVMGDGRNYSIHMFANAAGAEAPAPNCLLRIAPGAVDFDPDYHHTVPSLTGGLESIGEMETAAQGSGIGFAKVFYPDRLPEGVEPVSFAFWGERAHRTWRFELGDEPTAVEVEGLPFSEIGFTGVASDGLLWVGETLDGATSEVYAIDPETNRADKRFDMDGYFNGVYRLTRQE